MPFIHHYLRVEILHLVKYLYNSSFLSSISTERHRAEVRRVVNDDRLNAVAEWYEDISIVPCFLTYYVIQQILIFINSRD